MSLKKKKSAAGIVIKNARQHNLKNLSLTIPHGKLSVVTGPSGSGKSSLAFHTLYAEGQRRYVETFSPYVRQFFDRMDKPDVDSIDGILPAIAIEQKNHVRTTRSTVGTLTEINDYLKVYFSRCASGYDPVTDEEIKPDTPESVLAILLEKNTAQSVLILFSVKVPDDATPQDFFPLLNQQGFLRVVLYGKMFRTDEAAACSYQKLPSEIHVVQDRIQVSKKEQKRLLEALEAASRHGHGRFSVVSADDLTDVKTFTNDWVNPHTGFKLFEPSASLFSFNSPRGACQKCRGFGRVIGLDLTKAVPDPALSINQGCIKPFQGERGEECQNDLLRCAENRGINLNTPWDELSDADREWVNYGENGDPEEMWKDGKWYGIKGFFDWMETRAYKMHVRVFLSRYRSYTECSACRGNRLRPEALCFRVDGKTLADIWRMPVTDLLPWFSHRKHKEASIEIVRKEIESRLNYLQEVGLGYLTLDRQTRTLSGGEMERVNLTTCLGAALTNTLFVLDEPTVGLHARDINRLVKVMHRLRDHGNTLVVVEHEHAVMEAADEIIDIGPAAGEYGGTLVYQGDVHSSNKKITTGTLPWLRGDKFIPIPEKRRKLGSQKIAITAASKNNIRKLDVAFPLHTFTCLTGVSGSGKSTLAHDVLFLNLLKKLRPADMGDAEPARVKSITGDQYISDVRLVDQSPLARTPRSTPVVYCGAFEIIRNIFAAQPDARIAGLTSSYFSFNSGEGRCDRCAGAGYEKIEMQFLSDIQVKCPDCNGRRYRLSSLEYQTHEKSIADVLDMSVAEAITFFHEVAGLSNKSIASACMKVIALIEPMNRVGLGYVRLGQPLNTLSGGESQRLKLCELLKAGVHNEQQLLILDEPTTGLHFSDIQILLDVFQQLVEAGNSLLVIEHNMDVIAAADWIIELGPGAGNDGGKIAAQGTPEEIAKTKTETAVFLKDKLLGKVALTKMEKAEPPLSNKNCISLHGVRHHNLKNISLDIPRDELVVISGLSGSGKSSLAFDVLFAEGQRRFLDSMSAYARQFADQLEKPELDHLMGLPPTVAIEQRISQGGGKSTVATITEIWNFIRLLYSKLGTRYCCGKPVEKQSAAAMENIVSNLMKRGAVKIFAPLIRGKKGYHTEVAEWALKRGYHTLIVDKKMIEAASFTRLERFKEHDIDALISEITKKSEIKNVLDEALRIGKGTLRLQTSDGTFHLLSSHYACSVCSRSYEELDPRDFSFNSPHGWCSECRGYGHVPKLRRTLDISKFDNVLAAELDADRSVERMDDDELVLCPSCQGGRLRQESLQVELQGTTVANLTRLPIHHATEHFSTLKFSAEKDKLIARDIIPEIQQRLSFLTHVGLGYLQLDRSARTLSGGESQRIRLAAQLGSNLQGVLYVLDEPTIGLHPRDNAALLDTLISLRDRGNSLIVVEHDEDTIARADCLIDLGPAAGRFGGEVVFQGKLPKTISKKHESSPTLRAMMRHDVHPLRGSRRAVKKNHPSLVLQGCCVNNLKNVNVSIPLARLTVLTGLSGSGKSSLMHGCIAAAALKTKDAKTAFVSQKNFDQIAACYEMDQSPIGKTSRSCPATYVGIFDDIRKLFAQLPEAKARGYEPTRFSFNTEGGRCEECKGNGRIKLEMEFLPSAWIPCDTCNGKRYQSGTLEIYYREKTIADVLEMSIESASEFFEAHPRLQEPLRLLTETGLGYLTLGQASPTLSGGEAQRIKLVSEIARGRSVKQRLNSLKNQAKNLYLIEEPSVGLHLEDVHRLIDVLHRLVDEGHTVVVIEHHMAVAAEADWVIDIGPEAGENGGEIVVAGTPEEVAKNQKSVTAEFIKKQLG